MVRADHTPTTLKAYPVYSSAFVSRRELVLGGGGGASRSGIKNKLRLYKVDESRALHLLDELELEKGEDAPMSMAASTEPKQIICGVNSAAEVMVKMENQNCRVFGVAGEKMSLVGTTGTLNAGNIEDFQKVTVLSPNGHFLAVGGTKDMSLLHYPSLVPAALPVHIDQGEIYGASFSETELVLLTEFNILIYALPPVSEVKDFSTKGKGKADATLTLELVKTVKQPSLPGVSGGSTFRAISFHPEHKNIVYTITNVVQPRTKKMKTVPQQAFVIKWNTEKWDVVGIRKIGDRGVTCFVVSPNGRFLAYGSSGLTIGILDAYSLAPLLSILKAHEFPPTTMCFDPTSSMLVSGSADSTVRVVTVPPNLGDQSWESLSYVIAVILAIIMGLIITTAYQSMGGPSLRLFD